MSYRDYLKEELTQLIEKLELSELNKHFLKARWLDQLLWLESRAEHFRNRYYTLRLITIVGGVIVPALVGLNINNQDLRDEVMWIAFGLSQVVAVSAAVEEFFQYGDRFRHYRNVAETIKSEGWQFIQLSGSYHQASDHNAVYPNFAQRDK